MVKTPIELEYEAYIRTLYDQVRTDWENGVLTRSDAEAVARMIHERTSVADANPGAWDASSWCAEGDDAWDASGCSF